MAEGLALMGGSTLGWWSWHSDQSIDLLASYLVLFPLLGWDSVTASSGRALDSAGKEEDSL